MKEIVLRYLEVTFTLSIEVEYIEYVSGMFVNKIPARWIQRIINNTNGEDESVPFLYDLYVVFNLPIPELKSYINNHKPEYNINLIANSSLGVKRSEETKEKIRQANLGLKHPEWRNKIKSEAQGNENHWTQKKSFSEDSKRKMSESQKTLYDNGYKSPTAISVVEIDENNLIINKFDSLSKAGKYYNVDPMTVYNHINNGNSRKLKGKKLQYEE